MLILHLPTRICSRIQFLRPPLSFLPSFLPSFLFLFFFLFLVSSFKRARIDAIVINIRDEMDEGCRSNIVPEETSPSLSLSLWCKQGEGDRSLKVISRSRSMSSPMEKNVRDDAFKQEGKKGKKIPFPIGPSFLMKRVN